MRVIIHTGMHKTGTKSLQRLLSDSRDRLIQDGVYYPPGAHHHVKMLNAKSPRWTPDACRDALFQASAQNADTLLLSGECVSTLSSWQMRKLAECFRDCDVQVVICLRHWSGYLPSRWIQYCKRRDSQTFPQYLEALESNRAHIDQRYDLVLAHVALLGRVSTVSYDNAVASDGNVLGTMLRALDLPGCVVEQSPLTMARRLNIRIPWQKGEISRILNGVIAERAGLPQDGLFRARAEYRACDRQFDIAAVLSNLPPGLVAEFEATVSSRKVTRSLGEIPGTSQVVSALSGQFASTFVNAYDRRVFPSSVRSEVTFSDWAWDEFAGVQPALVDRALRALSLG